MQFQIKKVLTKKVLISLVGIGIATLGLAISESRLRPPSERHFIGPLNYSQIAQNSGIEIPQQGPMTVPHGDLSVEFSIVTDARPQKYAYIFSGGTPGNSDLAVSMDKFGNTFLELPTLNQDQIQTKVILVSGPRNIGEVVSYKIDFSANYRQLTILCNEKEVRPINVKNGEEIVPDEVFISNFNFLVGGPSSHRFNGSINQVKISYGELKNPIDGRNLRLFLVLLGMAILVRGLGFKDKKMRT